MTPVVACIVMVSESAVIGAVLLSLTDWSLKNAPLELTVAVAVTPPVPVTGAFTMSEIDVV